jgi:serine/threonine-protein kinase NIM1
LKKTLSTESRSSVGRRKKTSFWCSRTSKTSPLSASSSPLSLKPVEPIECYTKKYNNVPMEKFKNPLENTTIPNRNNSQSASRNNSQRNAHKNGGNNNVEIVQKNDIIQVRTYANENNNTKTNGEDVSISSESRDFEKFMMIPTQTNGDLSSLHPMEIETRNIMEKYGISRETLEKNAENGPRSEVIGIYRILIMRLKNMQEKEKAKELEANGNDMQSPPKTNSNSKHKSSTKKRIDATKCAIL